MSDNAASFTGSIPEQYDRGLGPVFFTDFADEMAKRVAAFAPQRVLETSAGTGIVSRRLRDLLSSGAMLTVTDLNPPMLDVARTKFSPGEAVTFQPADATDLPFSDRSFDALVCQFGIMFFPDKAKSYREAYRVLGPGGRYFFSVWDAHRFNPSPRLVHEFVARLFPDDPPRFYEVPFADHRIDPVRDAMTEAGFTDFRAAVLHIDKTVSDPAIFARGLIFGNPIVEQIRMRGGDPERIVDQIAELLRHQFGAPMRIPLQTIFFEAMRP